MALMPQGIGNKSLLTYFSKTVMDSVIVGVKIVVIGAVGLFNYLYIQFSLPFFSISIYLTLVSLASLVFSFSR